MAKGLSVNDVVNVTLNLSPTAAGYRNFGSLLILGSSAVIDTTERLRLYTTLDGVTADFGVNSPEYLAADLFFSQSPQPNLLYVGRWAQGATAGLIRGGVLNPTQRLLSNFTAITTGTLSLSVNGVVKSLTGLNFSTATNLNGVASIVQAALVAASTPNATVTWDSVQNRFTVTSGTTGTTSTVTAATGTVAAPMGLTSALASVPVNGVAAESLAQAVATLADVSSDWYGLTVATTTPPANSDHLAVAAMIEGMTMRRMYGITITSTDVLDPTTSLDLGSSLENFGYQRTIWQYSSSSPYAIASAFGRAFTVNFEANNTTITLKFKQEPGVVAELLTETQAATLKGKNGNVFVAYNNDTAIFQEGVMANGYFFDEVHGTDWLVNAVQTDVFNLLYQSPTKIPQTDAGMHQIVTTIEATLARAVNNGLVAPGQWNVAGFGQLKQGDTLPSGFYVYCPPVALQSQADREKRITPPIQVAAKLAGAVHQANILINVNR
ncbi:DUF3383 domain-containing protein [Methylobacterium sp. WL19]|uniref:DUF3383 domain-containing protein n=1 Tax=Methylobacterium sp. WL19 TaxID=2603896 RepID=UPI0011C77544|nr:DUF3383 domain-containing protein [Methylobacterium sp. WL19]TXN34018.1 DUF3383 domain-containing protein [Methylobacterium sp. WL19]